MDDVIIVGAGPGGASAAYQLGKAGLRVCVIEKEVLPRYKPCGGGISLQALAHYFPFSFDPVIESRAQSLSYAYNQDSIAIPVDQDNLAFVMRDRFDAYILEHARAEVHQGQAVQGIEELDDRVGVVTRDGAKYEGRYLIGADGANSIAARAIRRHSRRRPAAGLEIETPASPQALRMFAGAPLFILGVVNYGYAWVFPKGDHLSVGIAAFQPKPGELQAKVRSLMEGYGIGLDQGVWHGHPIPIFSELGKIATRRILLVGDAAGLVDPLTGEGIRLAIKSGFMAADAVLQENSHAYVRAVTRHIGFNHSLGLPLSALFYSLVDPCYALGVSNPYANRAFMDMLSDRTQYLAVILRMVSTLPLFAVRESAGWLGGWMREKIRAKGENR